jgi:hypothetical protein
MDPSALRGFLGLGLFIGVSGLVLAILLPPDSAEYVISVCSAAMGLTLVALVVIVSRVGNRG